MKILLRLAALISVCILLQGCFVTQMLFNPSVQAGFLIPKEITPLSEIKRDPKSFANEHIAISGEITEVADSFVLVEDFVTVKRHGFPWSQGIEVGDQVELKGKLVFPPFSRRGPELRYVDEFRPLPISELETPGTNRTQ